MMKLFEAIIHSNGKTAEQIKAKDSDYTDEDVQYILKWNAQIDGMKAVVTPSFDGDGYSLAFSDEKDKVKEAFYLMEQDSFFGSYIDQREEFDKDYDSGKYSPGGSMCFENEQVEIIRELEVHDNAK